MTKTTEKDDFSAFFLEEASVVTIDLPNGEPMLYQGAPVCVHVYGPATDRYIKAMDVQNREATKRVLNAMAKKSNKDQDDADANAKFLVAITDRIENFPYPGGADAVYREPRLKYIADQVRSYVADSGNFFKAGSTA